MNFNIYSFNSINSTSTYAYENAEKLKTPAMIIANEQTIGRGRRGNSFYSPADSGLYFTLLIKTSIMPESLTPAAAVAVCKAIEGLSDLKPQIKWVNDIFLNKKKVCGILCEAFVRNNEKYASIGIGINLTTTSFPKELTQAGSVGNIDKKSLANEIASYIGAYFEYPCRLDIFSEYDKRLFIKGMNISYKQNNEIFSAKALGINDKFNLRVLKPDGEEITLSSGEISIIIK